MAGFLVAELLVVVALATALALVERRAATEEAVRDARSLNHLEATDIVGPLLTDAALSAGPAQADLDQLVRSRVLGGTIVRVKLWDVTGRIVYSDDSRLIDHRFPLHDDELAALHDGQIAAEVSDLAAAENQDERPFGKLLEVYEGVRTPGGTPLLFETYQSYGTIRASSSRLFRASLPALLGGLAMLFVATAPLAHRLAVRLGRAQEEREALLLSTIAVADRERAIIAADLHDGVVQGLAGASLELAAMADRSPADADRLRRAAGDLRRWVRELRTLVVTITPPALHAQGLEAALLDLVAPLEAHGIVVDVDVDEQLHLEVAAEQLVFRTAQEAVRNVVRHADAHHATVSVRSAADATVLLVTDDGRGIADAGAARRTGSVGLELLGRLAADQGGALAVTPGEGGGTRLSLRLPR